MRAKFIYSFRQNILQSKEYNSLPSRWKVYSSYNPSNFFEESQKPLKTKIPKILIIQISYPKFLKSQSNSKTSKLFQKISKFLIKLWSSKETKHTPKVLKIQTNTLIVAPHLLKILWQHKKIQIQPFLFLRPETVELTSKYLF